MNAGANRRTPATGNTNPLIVPYAAIKRAEGLQAITENGIKNAKERTRSDSADRPQVNGVKKESALSQSPTLGAVHVNGDLRRLNTRHSPSSGNVSMPPPLNNAQRVASGSPLPQTPNLSNHIPTSHPPTTAFDNRWRQPGKGAFIELSRHCVC